MGKLYDLQKVKSEKEREKRWEEFDDEAFLENIYEKCRIEPKPGREILNLNVPEEWLDWPLHIENSLKLYDSPTFCNAPGVGGVTDACYEIWEAANSDILIKKLFNPKNDYFFGPFPIQMFCVTFLIDTVRFPVPQPEIMLSDSNKNDRYNFLILTNL